MRSMRREKVAGALQRPNGTWLNSYSYPLPVRNVVFSSSRSMIGTCRYPLFRSITTGDAQELLEGRMTPLASFCWTCAISSA